MNNKNESINLLDYGHKILNNYHIKTRFNYLSSLHKTKKIIKLNKSNSSIFPILYSNNENNKEKNLISTNENKIKRIIFEKMKIKNKQNNYMPHKKLIIRSGNLPEIKTKTSNYNDNEIKDNKEKNKNISDRFYRFICLGKDAKESEIEKVSSPLVKYFLYNIIKNNKRNIKFNKHLHITKKNDNNNFNISKLNLSLIKKNTNNSYINNSLISLNKKIINEYRLNSEESSSSENYKTKNLRLENIIKNEDNKKKNFSIRLSEMDDNPPSCRILNDSKKIKTNEFSNDILNKIKGLKLVNFDNKLVVYKRPSVTSRSTLNFMKVN